MNWKYQIVQQWRDWNKRPHREVLPSDIQIGKVLEFCLLDESRALDFFNQQIEHDENFYVTDGYWPSVKQRFQELQVINLIME
jgi:hypothetical protein